MTGTTISGSYLGTVTLSDAGTQNPATVAGGATIAATGIALAAEPGAVWTIANYGSVAGYGAAGVGIYLEVSATAPAVGGVIYNRATGTIYGANHGVALGGALGGTPGGAPGDSGTVFNQGTILGGGSGTNSSAIYLAGGGYVTNQSGGVISAAGSGIIGMGAGAVTVVNQGAITATGNGVDIGTGGSVTNQSGGMIQAGGNGVELLVAPSYEGSVANLAGGTIQAGGYGVYVCGGTAVNQGYISASGGGLLLVGGSTGTNETGGTITAGGNGVALYGGGTFTNQSGATISGGIGIIVNLAGTVVSPGTGVSAGTVINAGAVTGANDGVVLADGGTFTNQSGGSITGPEGIVGGTIAVTVVNDGEIGSGAIGATLFGVFLAGGGTITNQGAGTISGFGGLFAIDAAVTVINYGDIAASGADGVGLFAGGTISNQSGGTISGYDGIYGASPIYVVNAGTIQENGTFGIGILLTHGGSVSNQSGGTISGYGGIYDEACELTVVNAGTIAASACYGVLAGGGGTISNQSGGTISGVIAVYAYHTAATVVNAGAVLGSMASRFGAGIALRAGGSVTNQSGGTISGYHGVYAEYASLTVVNYGTIDGPSGAIGLFAGGTVTNQSGGTISGSVAILSGAAATTVVNYGAISGGLAVPLTGGVVLLEGGSVSNQSGGTIAGYDGIYGGGGYGALTVVNAGSIASPGGDGIVLQGGGIVTNQTGGSITGYQGVIAETAAVTVVNYGSIAATGTLGIAVDLLAGGSVTNAGGGSIGGGYGVEGGKYGALTVVNAGQISGTGAALRFTAGYADLLVVDPGAVFGGVVDGGNLIGATVASTLELAAGGAFGTLAGVGTLAGIGTQFVDFAQVTIDGGASWTLTGANYFAAGTTLTNAGTLTVLDTSLSDAGLVVNDGAIQIGPSTVMLASLSGTGGVTIGGGGTLEVSGLVTSGETIVFGDGNGLLGADPIGFAGQIDGFTFGDTIELSGVTDGSSAAIVNSNTLEVQRARNPAVDLTLDPGVDDTGDAFAVSDTGAVTEVVPCFLAGTLIRTGRGEVPVELLAVGDRVVTLSGSSRPIRWIGHRRLDPARHPAPHRVQPIHIRAHAFGEGRPKRDLWLSPDHAVLWDGGPWDPGLRDGGNGGLWDGGNGGVRNGGLRSGGLWSGGLVPVRLLVNGASIRRDTERRSVTYYHVELETHDILLAENLAVESYLETGNRGMFENTNEPLRLHPDLTSGQRRRLAESCAPFLDDPARVQPIWQALARRAERRGLVLPPPRRTTDDPALCLIADGRRVAPIGITHGRHAFVVPAGATELRLRSRSAMPSDLTPWVSDDRRLGVLLRGLTVRTGADAVAIPLDHPGLRAGWWQPEWHGSAILRRWTNGDAVVPLPEPAPDQCLLEVEVAATMAYPRPHAAAEPPVLATSRPLSLRRSA